MKVEQRLVWLVILMNTIVLAIIAWVGSHPEEATSTTYKSSMMVMEPIHHLVHIECHDGHHAFQGDYVAIGSTGDDGRWLLESPPADHQSYGEARWFDPRGKLCQTYSK